MDKIYFVNRGDFTSEIIKEKLNPEDSRLLELFMGSNYLKNYEFPLVIDFLKAKSLYLSTNGDLDRVIKFSRLSIMGTDGIRGKISLDLELNPFNSYFRDNILTPQLIKLVSLGFCSMLINNSELKIGDNVIVGNDGRDICTDYLLKQYMTSGFNNSGINTIDIGIIPTPYVPYNILLNDYKAGAMLTASHNPANQNGIKFFINGSKMLPDGKLGDYSLTYWVFFNYFTKLDKLHDDKNIGINSKLDTTKSSMEFIKNSIPQDFYEVIKDRFIFVDSANGAYYNLIPNLLEGLNYKHLDSIPNGININQGCGVAEIEGKEIFLSSDYESSTKIVQSIFDYGRAENKRVSGIVLDGDGDRAFILLYDHITDSVLTLDGDKCGYLLASYFIGLDPNNCNKHFITTVESDIMTAYSANSKLNIKTDILSVGDKWIGNYKDGELLLGLESSGHLILPIDFLNKSSKKVNLRSGNGLLTAMLVLYVIEKMNLSPNEAYLPYKQGYSKTYYIYNVNKNLFYPGSSLWNLDKDLIIKELSTNIHLKDYRFEFQDKEDLQMLYLSISSGETQVAGIFCRNSGTEDKSAVYIKCKNELSHILLPIGKKLRDLHIDKMKDRDKTEFKYEVLIMDKIKKENKLSLSELKDFVADKTNNGILDNDLNSIIYGLKKEERVVINNSLIEIVERK